MLSIFFESCTIAIFKYKNNRVNNDRNLYSFSIFRKRKYKVGKFKIWYIFILIFRTFSTIHLIHYLSFTKSWFTEYLSILPIVRICNCQWNICQYTKCHTIKCHTQRIVIYLKLWLIISFFILLNDIQEKITIHKGHRDHKCNSCEK